jgi:uncharacterized membrane protein YiaA
LAFELLEKLLVSPGLLQIPVSTFWLALFGPDASLSHLGFYFGIFVIVNMIAVNLLSSKFCQASSKQLNDDVLRIINDISKLGLIDFFLDDEG